MIVNFEFLGNEPIENVITCMNYKIDKVVFFGYEEVIREQKDRTVKFLEEFCGVRETVFHSMSHRDLQSILSSIRKEIQYELSLGSKIYFDITGGESLILVAFGMLAREFDTPMHIYDIPEGRLIELDEGAKSNISRDVEKAELKVTLEMLIRMRGGVIDTEHSTDIDPAGNDELAEDIENLWQVMKENAFYWNDLTFTMQNKQLKPDDDLVVRLSCNFLEHRISWDSAKFLGILKKMERKGLIELCSENRGYRLKFKNSEICSCLRKTGNILEWHTFLEEKKHSDEAKTGVLLDWDGRVHQKVGEDVRNEIDVLSLNGYIPVFISCKIGKMDPVQTLHALYELNTVASKFGGRYAKKVLVTINELRGIDIERAAEMGIEVRVV